MRCVVENSFSKQDVEQVIYSYVGHHCCFSLNINQAKHGENNWL